MILIVSCLMEPPTAHVCNIGRKKVKLLLEKCCYISRMIVAWNLLYELLSIYLNVD